MNPSTAAGKIGEHDTCCRGLLCRPAQDEHVDVVGSREERAEDYPDITR